MTKKDKELISKLKSDLKWYTTERELWRNKFYDKEVEYLKLRTWIKSKFDWWIELIAETKQPCLKYLIKNTAEILGMKP